MSRPIIEVENVSKRYRLGQFNAMTLREELGQFFQRFWSKNAVGDTPHAPNNGSEFWALKDVSFSVQPGEVVGIIGSNGAGKSTLLKILSRVTEPTRGQIRIRGRVASLLEVGTGFHPDLSGRENIYLNGTILGMTKAEVKAKFDEIIAFAEIDKFLDTPVKRYSSGMYVRLAFAVAAHLEPEILIVDEVLAVGDVEFQKKCLGKMKEVSGKDGRTVLFVSHNLAAIKALTQQSLYLRSGNAAFFGPTSTGIDMYLRGTKRNGHREPSIQKAGTYSRVLDVSLLDKDGCPTNTYPSDTPLVLDATIETDGTKGLSFDIHVLNSTGQRVYFYNSNLFDGFDLPSSKGCYKIRISFKPLRLAAGSYSIDFATAVTNFSLDNYVSAAVMFEIPYFNPVGSSWDFRESDGSGMIALSPQAPISIRKA